MATILPTPRYVSCFGDKTPNTQPWPNQGGSLLANHQCGCMDGPRPSDQWSAPPPPSGVSQQTVTEAP